MANNTYRPFRTRLLSPGVNLLTANLKAMLVSSTTGVANFPYNQDHEFLAVVPNGAVVAAGVALTNKAVTNGLLTASPLIFPTVSPVGAQTGEALVLFIDTGVAGTSPLVAWMDAQTGLPVVPNGSNITINWPTHILAAGVAA